MCAKNDRVWFVRNEGGLHERIWFAKAGKGNDVDRGISPEPEFHLKNASYSFTLAFFDPRGMSLKEAQEAGKESSVFGGMGGQFGAQVWRIAHEAQVGDYIFLESENHHLHAVGFIAGAYEFHGDRDRPELTATLGCHSIPVHWVAIANGRDAIQLGRLDNAVFRNVVEKEELACLLLDLTRKITPVALGIAPEDIPTTDSPTAVKMPQPEPLLPAGEIRVFDPTAPTPKAAPKAKAAKPRATNAAPTSPAPAGRVEAPAAAKPQVEAPTLFKVSRDGQVLFELSEQGMLDGLASGKVRPNDFYWINGMPGWEMVSSRFKAQAVASPRPVQSPPRSASGKVLDFHVATSTGLILGSDGCRYAFRGSEWRTAGCLPLAGLHVNFVVLGQDATSIYVVGATSDGGSVGSSKVNEVASGYYRSSDQKFIGGVCAGLAHKWDRSALILRLVFFIFYPLLLVYVIMWLALPERPTKR